MIASSISCEAEIIWNYDGEYSVPCIDANMIGEMLLSGLAEAKPHPTNWRYLTPGEKATAAAEGLVIRNVDKVRVYNSGFTIFGAKLSYVA